MRFSISLHSRVTVQLTEEGKEARKNSQQAVTGPTRRFSVSSEPVLELWELFWIFCAALSREPPPILFGGDLICIPMSAQDANVGLLLTLSDRARVILTERGAKIWATYAKNGAAEGDAVSTSLRCLITVFGPSLTTMVNDSSQERYHVFRGQVLELET